MSRSNYDKPFYVDVGTSIVSIRCASNHDIVVRYDYVLHPHTLKLAEEICDSMNMEVEICRPLRNCDVGTAEEQIKRHRKWCKSDKCLTGVPCSVCFAKWSQMPYEKEGAN